MNEKQAKRFGFSSATIKSREELLTCLRHLDPEAAAQDLMAALRRPRPFWLGVVEWAADRAAMRARLREIEEEMAS